MYYRLLKKLWEKLCIHHTIHFKTIREHLKFYNGLWCKVLCKVGLLYPSIFSPIGTSLELTTQSQLILLRKYFPASSTEYKVSRELEELLGKKIKLDYHSDIYTLIGLEITHEDLYYLLEDESGRRIYDTILNRYRVVE